MGEGDDETVIKRSLGVWMFNLKIAAESQTIKPPVTKLVDKIQQQTTQNSNNSITTNILTVAAWVEQ